MTNSNAVTPRQKRVNRFFLAAFIGGGAWLVSLALYLTLIALGLNAGGWLIWLNYAIFLLFFAALIVQFRHRDADEFTHELWHTASSAAFILTVGWMLFASQIEGWLNIAYSSWSGEQVRTAYAFFWAFQMPMLSFYLVFFTRHLRNR